MKSKKAIAILCSVSLLVMSLTGCGKAEMTEEEKVQNSIREMDSVVQTLEQANVIKHSDNAGKEETVYVLLDANGNQNETIVSEWLKNPEGAETVYDTSFLSDMEVVKGTASFTQNEDNSVIWNADGGDIYYQGKTDKEAPVSVSVTYELDGTRVDASAIDRANGHLKVTYDYANNASKEIIIQGDTRTVFQPFAMISGAMFDNEKATNITVTNGKAINSGDYTIVFGMAMPGLKESLGIDDEKIHIPESVTIEADVVDFSMPMTVTVASNNALAELGLDDFDSLDELKEKTELLEDGMSQLMDGADQLNDGMNTLSDGTMTLWDGTLDLVDGAGQLKDGAASLSSGANELSEGARKLSDGANQVNGGANALKDGLHQLQDKTPELANGVNELKSGAGALNDGLNQVNANSEALNNGVAGLVQGANQLAGALNPDGDSVQTLRAGATSLMNGTESAREGVNQLLTNYQSVTSNLSGISQSLEVYIASLNTVTLSEEPSEEEVAAYDMTQNMIATLSELQNGVQACVGGLEAINTQTAGLAQSMGSIAAGATSLDAGINEELVGALTQAQIGANALCAGATQLQSGVSAYTAGVASCADGAGKLNDGLSTLQGQIPALTDGVAQLTDGADRLADGTNELAGGAGDLASGSVTLADGATSLADGTKKLSDGTGNLKDGVISLSDGVSKLLDGSADLKDGVIDFNDEGISKITDLVNNDIDKYYDRLVAVRDYAKEYTTFAGANDGIDSSVKFIFKTEPVKR